MFEYFESAVVFKFGLGGRYPIGVLQVVISYDSTLISGLNDLLVYSPYDK